MKSILLSGWRWGKCTSRLSWHSSYFSWSQLWLPTWYPLNFEPSISDFNFWFSDNYACDIFWFGNKAWLPRSVDCLCAVSQNTQTVQNDDSANLQIYIIKMAAYMCIVYGFWKNHISISKTQWYKRAYEKVSDVPESRVWFASKNLTPCSMH